MNPPRGMYPPRGIAAGFISLLPAILPLVLPADMSIASFGFESDWVGAHPLGLVGAFPPRCARSLAFMCR